MTTPRTITLDGKVLTNFRTPTRKELRMPEPLTDAEIAELREEISHWFQSAVPLQSYDIECVYKALPRLLDEVTRARALLKRIEWGRYGGECPGCGEMPEGGHAPDCELAVLIGK